MSDATVNDETWKSAWIEFFVEMVALDTDLSSNSVESLEKAHTMVKRAAAIENAINDT